MANAFWSTRTYRFGCYFGRLHVFSGAKEKIFISVSQSNKILPRQRRFLPIYSLPACRNQVYKRTWCHNRTHGTLPNGENWFLRRSPHDGKCRKGVKRVNVGRPALRSAVDQDFLLLRICFCFEEICITRKTFLHPTNRSSLSLGVTFSTR